MLNNIFCRYPLPLKGLGSRKFQSSTRIQGEPNGSYYKITPEGTLRVIGITETVDFSGDLYFHTHRVREYDTGNPLGLIEFKATFSKGTLKGSIGIHKLESPFPDTVRCAYCGAAMQPCMGETQFCGKCLHERVALTQRMWGKSVPGDVGEDGYVEVKRDKPPKLPLEGTLEDFENLLGSLSKGDQELAMEHLVLKGALVIQKDEKDQWSFLDPKRTKILYKNDVFQNKPGSIAGTLRLESALDRLLKKRVM